MFALYVVLFFFLSSLKSGREDFITYKINFYRIILPKVIVLLGSFTHLFYVISKFVFVGDVCVNRHV